MRYSKSLHNIVLSVAAGGLLWACDGNTNADASDGTDAVTDVGTDVAVDVTTDVAPDTNTTDAAVDAPVDAPTDAPACTATVSAETEFPHVMNGIWVAEYDATTIAMGATDTVVFSSTSPVAATAIASEGNCAYYGDLFGGPARSMAVQRNYGPMTVTQGTAVTSISYDATMHGYTGDTSLSTPMFPGTDATIAITGGPDGLAGAMGVVRQPPRWPANLQSPPAVLSRTADTVIPFNPPAGIAPDAPVLIEITAQADFSNTIFCAVPACAHQVTVPAALAARLESGAAYLLYIGTQNHADVGTTAQPLRFWMSTGDLYGISIE